MIAIGTELDLGGPGGWIPFELPRRDTKTAPEPADDLKAIGPGLKTGTTWRASVAAGVSAMVGVAIGAIGLAALTPAGEPPIGGDSRQVRNVEHLHAEQASEASAGRNDEPFALPAASRELADESMLRTAEVIRAAIKRAQERERAGGHHESKPDPMGRNCRSPWCSSTGCLSLAKSDCRLPSSEARSPDAHWPPASAAVAFWRECQPWSLACRSRGLV